MSKSIKVFVLEGESKEDTIINMMSNCFFSSENHIIINLPVSQNIYMLYLTLKKYDFEIDFIELLRSEIASAEKALQGIKRQQIDQIYMFFDYDPQQKNLPNILDPYDVLREMLGFFSDETDQGKLYLSYPMAEAIYDFKSDMCQAHTNCMYDVEELIAYKHNTGENNRLSSAHLQYEMWHKIINTFILRIKCLFEFDNINYDEYVLNISPENIFFKENEIINNKNNIFILSAFPEFLLDYHKVDFWNRHYRKKRYSFIKCQRGRIKNNYLRVFSDIY